MRLPEPLLETERLPVAGRQGWRHLQRLSFGDQSVERVQRSLTKGGDLQILRYEGSKRRQSFSFEHLDNGNPAFQVVAATNLRRRAIELKFDIELHNRSGFTAELRSVSNPAQIAVLELTENGERPLEGTLIHGHQRVDVKGTRKLAGSVFPLDETTGYVFEWERAPIAAVEVINDGAVWISPAIDADLRAPVCAAISALLLFEELRQTLPE